MAEKKKNNNNTVDYDSFKPQTGNEFVNEAIGLPANVMKFLDAVKKKKEALKKAREGN